MFPYSFAVQKIKISFTGLKSSRLQEDLRGELLSWHFSAPTGFLCLQANGHFLHLQVTSFQPVSVITLPSPPTLAPYGSF